MNELTFMILKIIVSICSALITLFVIPYVHRLSQNERFKTLNKIIEISVNAAEQVLGSGTGKNKKEMVINFMHKWLYEHGENISDEQLDSFIEAAVYGLKVR